jgi:predicted NBD/HSP70 family sugar kinase
VNGNGKNSDLERLLTEVASVERTQGYKPTILELANRLHLSRPTIERLIDRAGSLKVDTDRDGPGRPIHRVSIDEREGRILAVALGHSTVRVGLAKLLDDEDGPWIAGKAPGDYGRTTVPPGADGLQRIEIAASAVEELISDEDRSTIAGVGLVVPAPLDRNTKMAYSGLGADQMWQRVRFSDNLLTRLPGLDCEVVVINDANSSLRAEQSAAIEESGQLGSLADAFYLHWATGVGGALAISGEIYQGSAGYAGEVGHVVVPPFPDVRGSSEAQDRQPDEWPRLDDLVECKRCRQRGCLESIASGEAICQRLAQKLPAGGPTSTTELVAWCQADDDAAEICRAEIARAAKLIGRSLGLVATVLNPAVIVVGGRVPTVGADVWLTPMQRAFACSVMPPADASVTFAPARLRDNTTLRGAVEAARDEALVPWLVRRKSAAKSGA